MTEILTRRGFLTGTAVATAGLMARPAVAETAAPGAGFPATDPERARQIVGVSHFDVDQVRALLAEDRGLALACWDWGFGDWETALGAASHTGRHEIAEVLIAHGARPDLFTLAMMDRVDAVRAICEASPGIQEARGPHGITLLSHAIHGKAERVEAYLRELGGAGVGETSLGLPEDQHDVYLGEYGFDGDGGVCLVVEGNKFGGIGILRSGGTHRVLHRTGDHVFSPSGAPHVSVRFAVEQGRAVGLSVHRGRPVLSATRISD